MYGRCFFIIATLLWSSCIGASAQEPYTLRVGGGCMRNLGYSSYDLRVADAGSTVYSKLEFPLDSFFLGSELTLFLGDVSERDWDFLLGAYINLNTPAGKMLDHDWIQPTGFPKLKFSYTESDARMFMLTINMRAHKKLTSLGMLDLFLSFGYSLYYISQNIKGYRGWQIDLSDGTIHDIQGDEQALTYDIFYHLPHIGLLLSIEPVPRLILEGEFLGLIALAHDVDDHVIRNKLSTSFGIGVGINPAARIFYYIPCGDKVTLFLCMECDFTYIFIAARQRQEWYADDPGTPGDETGTVLTNIIHDISNIQLNGGLKIGVCYEF